MAHSPTELRRQSEALLAHAKCVRVDAEQARLNAVRCRENANAARATAELCRTHSNAAQDRQDARRSLSPTDNGNPSQSTVARDDPARSKTLIGRNRALLRRAEAARAYSALVSGRRWKRS
jgi:hypothetical protein